MTKETLVKKFPYFKTVDFDHAFDNLTEVFTREVIGKYIRRLVEEKKPFSLFIADVDNFKYINDGYGHKAGDEVLSGIAQFLMDSVGMRGVVGRYGGDEFLLVCEGLTEYKDVWDIGHEINMTIGNLRFSNESIPSITISMGIARYPVDTLDYEELWTLADKALYRGKMKGRNCFIIYLESKHKNLDLKAKRDLSFSSMYLHAKIFDTLTGTSNLAAAIRNQLRFLVTYYMFDHLCVETRSGMKFNMVHSLAKNKDFKPLDYNEISKIVDNSGLAYANKISSYNNIMGEEFVERLKEQKIVSAVYCKIAAFDKEFGYIRIEMTDTARIWQNGELDIIITTARLIGLSLYYSRQTIEELDDGKTETVGEEK